MNNLNENNIIDIEEFQEEGTDITKMTESDFSKLEQFGFIGECMKKIIGRIMKFNNRINQTEDQSIKNENKIVETQEMVEAAKKVNSGSKVYFSQTELGNSYNPPLSANAVGNLLRIIGLAYKNTPTRPLRTQAVETGIAKMFGNNFKWEREKVHKKWMEWLKEHDLYVKWNKLSTPTEARLFVKELHEEYVE